MKLILVCLVGVVHAGNYSPDFVTDRGSDTGCRDLSELDNCVSRIQGYKGSCSYLNAALECANNNGCSVRHKNWIEDAYVKYSDVKTCGFYPDVEQKTYSQCLQNLGTSYTCREISDALHCLTRAKGPLFRIEMLKERLESKIGLTCDPFKCAVLQGLGNILVCPKMNSIETPCQDEMAMKTCLNEVVYFADKCRMWYQIRKCAGLGRCTEFSIKESKRDFENKYGVTCQECTEFQSLDYLRVCTYDVEACSERRVLEECVAEIKDSGNKCDVWQRIADCLYKGKCTDTSMAKAKSDFLNTYQVQCGGFV